MESTSIIKLNNVSKSYNGTKALNNCTCEVQRGEIFGLLGPNGAGKTTTLEIIEGLIHADQGSVQVCNGEMPQEAEKVRRRMGIQLQNSGLPNDITAGEAIKLFAAYRKVKVNDGLLNTFKLDKLTTKKYSELSGGQKKSLQLCLALLHDPELVILDEPTAALDVETRNYLHAIIKDLKSRGKTVIISTHDMSEAESLCDRIAILIKGEIAALGTPREITSGNSRELKISIKSRNSTLLDNPDFVRENIASTYKLNDYRVYFSDNATQSILEIIKKIEQANDEIIDFRVERPSLEEKLIELIQKGKKI